MTQAQELLHLIHELGVMHRAIRSEDAKQTLAEAINALRWHSLNCVSHISGGVTQMTIDIFWRDGTFSTIQDVYTIGEALAKYNANRIGRKMSFADVERYETIPHGQITRGA
jgi:hypothetical protein